MTRFYQKIKLDEKVTLKWIEENTRGYWDTQTYESQQPPSDVFAGAMRSLAPYVEGLQQWPKETVHVYQVVWKYDKNQELQDVVLYGTVDGAVRFEKALGPWLEPYERVPELSHLPPLKGALQILQGRAEFYREDHESDDTDPLQAFRTMRDELAAEGTTLSLGFGERDRPEDDPPAWWEILDVDPADDRETVQVAYWIQRKRFHPQTGTSPDGKLFTAVEAAWNLAKAVLESRGETEHPEEAAV